ncbi:BamA/TamA family outer membrane protein [Epibacterium sp. SM1969]|uniref:BamA/TamA family outer membrane protein n=1 Tax=Tritonibacter aquimaris TaxID=2663379 RepID=A0A844AKJ2_9RHOB|nr:BamA/TamA family outer membrane protein [Tritonibacter aquimaris]MQY42230.1 BamA/TamA family outer membrane protein [Tritonibacter aquimaris]
MKLAKALPRWTLAIFISCAALPAFSLETQFTATGADTDLKNRLKRASTVTNISKKAATQDVLAAALSDYRSLVQVLYDEGYFAPIVSIKLDGREAAALNPLALPQTINSVNVAVQPGPTFQLGRAEIAPLPNNTELPEGFRSGERATTGVLRDAATAGISAWRDAGHAKARIQQQNISANHRTNQLSADIRIAPGAELKLGRLLIEGQSDVRPDAIQRIAGFPTGETFHPDLISKSAERLRRTGAFASVALREAENANPNDTLDVTAAISDLPKRRLTFGTELSSSDGVELSASWIHRNLFGGAERLTFEARLSGIGGTSDIDGRVAVRLDRPATLGPDDNMFYLLEAERLDEEHFSAVQGIGTIGVRRLYSDTLTGEISAGFASILATDAFGKRRFKYLLARARLEQDLRDNRVSATDGTYLLAQAVPFVGIDGTESGLQLVGDGRIYRSLGERLVIAGRVQFGSVLGPSLSEVSPTLGFFSGGAGTVRGHEFQSLGVPAGSDTAAGRGFLALSAEIRRQVSDKISLVGFYDVGLISDQSFLREGNNQHAGAGFGLRYDITGIGPLRLDLAVPVSGGSGDGLQFYIGVGQAF